MGKIDDALKKAEAEREARRQQDADRDAESLDLGTSPEGESSGGLYEATGSSTETAEGGGFFSDLLSESGSETTELAFDECLLTVNNPTDRRSEQFRSIKTNIKAMDPEPQTIILSSAVGGEGKSITCANLAVTFAEEADERVLIIEADVRKPHGSNLFRLPSDLPGLGDVLLGHARPEDVVIESGVPNVWIVPVGRMVPNPGALIGAAPQRGAMEYWKQTYDRILLDTPPVIAVNDALVLGRQVDGVLLVVKLGSTPRRLVAKAVASFGATGVRVLGCVLTGSSDEDNTIGYAYGGQQS